MEQKQELKEEIENMLESAFGVTVNWNEDYECYIVNINRTIVGKGYDMHFKKLGNTWQFDYTMDGNYIDFDEAGLWRFLFWEEVPK